MKILGLIFVGIFMVIYYSIKEYQPVIADKEESQVELQDASSTAKEPEQQVEPESEFSDYGEGIIEPETAAVKTDMIIPPEYIMASDGTDTDKVYISWSVVVGADKYYIYRSEYIDGIYEEIGYTAKTNYYDEIVAPNIDYYYKVKTWSNLSGFSDFSVYDSGNSSRIKLQKMSDFYYKIDNFNAGETKWFYFDAIKDMRYSVSWGDSNSYINSSIYNCDIKVSAYRADQTIPYFLDKEYPEEFISVATEEVYIKIQGDYHADNGSGTYSISVEERENENYTFVLEWDSKGRGDGQIIYPAGIAVSTNGFYMYIVDTDNHRVQKFDQYGNIILSWGGEGTGEGQFKYPKGIVATPGLSFSYIYVVDSYNNRIQKFEDDGTFVRSWGNKGAENGQFLHPTGIAIDSNWGVYVVDSGNNRIQIFNQIGNYITSWGCKGTDEGQFDNPRDIAIDSNGFVYITDTRNHRVQKFGK